MEGDPASRVLFFRARTFDLAGGCGMLAAEKGELYMTLLEQITEFLYAIDPSGALVAVLAPLQQLIEFLLSPFFVLGLIFGPLFGLFY